MPGLAHYFDRHHFDTLLGDLDANRDEIGRMIHRLCNGVAKRYWIGRNPDDEDEAVQSAALRCWHAVQRGKIIEGRNSFAYLTTVAVNAMKRFGGNLSRERPSILATLSRLHDEVAVVRPGTFRRDQSPAAGKLQRAA
ncbi:MAG: sigma factor [Planctomycetota bacterium]